MVKSKDSTIKPKDVAKKVVSEVGPSLAELGVRVHQVKAVKGGGAIIRTPSVAEREKLAKSAKFSEVGLEVEVQDKIGPRVVVHNVDPAIKPEVFMDELYALNFKEKMTKEEFSKSVKMVTGAWKDAERSVNVVLEGKSRVTDALLAMGRCYIKWFSFLVRPHDGVHYCYRCLSFDHKTKHCRFGKVVCRRCGEEGHYARSCRNALNCRNCAFRGKPSEHLMMSEACPLYSLMVARAKSRH